MNKILGLCFLMLASCAVGSDLEGGTNCKPLSGIFDMRFTETKGDCGAVASSVINFDYKGTNDCEVTQLPPNQNVCHYSLDFKCPRSARLHSIITASVTMAVDGESGYGTMQLSVADNTTDEKYCTSDYEIVFSRHQ
jgi:hypothetical protein